MPESGSAIMSPPLVPPERHAVSKTRALLALAALVALSIWGLLPSSAPLATDAPLPPPGKGDAALYLKVIDRLGTGEPYYEALGEELRLDDYPTRSPFNWRTPFHLVMVAYATVPAATLTLKLLTLGAVLATTFVLAGFGRVTATVGTVAQMGALATAFSPQAVGVAEVWAGVLVALSACAYYRTWWIAGALLGVAAVFVRELAAPYCVACAIIAIGQRRREAVVWIVAGLAYAAYFGLHVWQVNAQQLPVGLAHTQPWHQWNGLRFTLATIGVNGWLAFVPRQVAVVWLVLALGGTVSRRMAPQVRYSLFAYFILFSVVGLPFNAYWGYVNAPLWAFGLAHTADGLRTLVLSARADHHGAVRAGSRV